MRFGYVLLEENPAVVAMAADARPGDWHRLDIANDLPDVLEADWSEVEASYRRGQSVQADKLRFLAPITRPGKIVAIGLNYMDHCREQNIKPPDKPLIFAKFPSTITGPHTLIEWDPALTGAVDYEAELAVIIGKQARRVNAEQALRYVFGYTCANDVTARDLQHGDGQWVRGKSLDTFCPLGPVVVTANEIETPQKLAIRCEVNGQRMQDSNTSEMVFDVKTIVAYASQAFTLYPGDIILTGTPHGVGYSREPRVLLHNGDTVAVEIERIGRLENTCREVTQG
jgi:2-keto-4-pentenoate hydratase/2-oxohepta-3-ene-1,7-dioic acid hydratase in catechol pathway